MPASINAGNLFKGVSSPSVVVRGLYRGVAARVSVNNHDEHAALRKGCLACYSSEEAGSYAWCCITPAVQRVEEEPLMLQGAPHASIMAFRELQLHAP